MSKLDAAFERANKRAFDISLITTNVHHVKAMLEVARRYKEPAGLIRALEQRVKTLANQ